MGMRRPQAQQWIIRGSIASAVSSVVIAACVTDEHPRPTCAALVDGGPPPVTPTPDRTYFAVPSTDAQAPTALGIEADPGPTCTNCQAGDQLEVMLVSDFEDGYGPAWINYGEPGSWVEPHSIGAALDADGKTISPPQYPYFGLQATDLRTAPGGVRCNSRYALHMVGGPFLSWGGGYATQFVTVRGEQYKEQYCRAVDRAVSGIGELPEEKGDSCRFWMAPVAGQPSRLGIDVSAFDGIALWARRGPGAAAALRVALIDVNTAKESALNAELRGQEPACKRVVECCRQCGSLTHAVFDAGATGEFTLGEVTDMRCHLPGEPMPPFRLDAGVIEVQTGYPDPDAGWKSVDGAAPQDATNAWESWNRDYEPCCPPTLAEDPKYGGNEPGECDTYVFKYDPSSGNFCQRPGEILPEKNDNRCEDGFETSIQIDTEWKLFTIPWSELRRSTIGRPPIDPSSIWTIRLYPTAGWLDTYIDDIGFYRKRQ
jgi:hypothetical protein